MRNKQLKTNQPKKDQAKERPQIQPLKLEQLDGVAGGFDLEGY